MSAKPLFTATLSLSLSSLSSSLDDPGHTYILLRRFHLNPLSILALTPPPPPPHPTSFLMRSCLTDRDDARPTARAVRTR